MLIDLTRPLGPRIDIGLAPKSLVVAVMDGKVTQRSPTGLQFKLDNPDSCAAAGQGRTISAFRLRPGDAGMGFQDSGEQGWEFSAWSQNDDSHDYTYIVLGHELRGDRPDGWVCWFRHGQAMQRMVFMLPEYDPTDNSPFMLDPFREVVPPGPSRYELLGQDA